MPNGYHVPQAAQEELTVMEGQFNSMQSQMRANYGSWEYGW